MSRRINEIEQVLSRYGLVPTSIIQKGRAYKVTTSHGDFALKSLPREKEYSFMETQSILSTHAVYTLPVFSTGSGELLVRGNDLSYYLTPWVDDESRNENQKWEVLVNKLAQLHRRTSKIIPVTGSERENERADWAYSYAALEQFMYRAEHRPYPSPFEQRFLLLFYRIMGDAEKTQSIMTQLHKTDDQPAEQRIAFCYGEPKLDHICLYKREAFLINFDHTYWGPPVLDVAALFRSCPLNPEWMIRLYDQYQTTHPLNINEKKQLLAELIKPEPFVKIINKYSENRGASELEFISELHELCEKRQQRQPFLDYLEKEISDESNPLLDPSLEKTDIEPDEQHEDNHIEGRRPENGPDHLEDSEG